MQRIPSYPHRPVLEDRVQTLIRSRRQHPKYPRPSSFRRQPVHPLLASFDVAGRACADDARTCLVSARSSPCRTLSRGHSGRHVGLMPGAGSFYPDHGACFGLRSDPGRFAKPQDRSQPCFRSARKSVSGFATSIGSTGAPFSSNRLATMNTFGSFIASTACSRPA